MQKTELYGNVYNFSVDYWPSSTNKIRDIHRCLMRKSQYCLKCLGLSRKYY